MRTSGTGVDRRHIALGVVFALAATASLGLLTELHAASTWVHWLGSTVALIAALATVVIAEATWQRALEDATSVGLVGPVIQGTDSVTARR